MEGCSSYRSKSWRSCSTLEEVNRAKGHKDIFSIPLWAIPFCAGWDFQPGETTKSSGKGEYHKRTRATRARMMASWGSDTPGNPWDHGEKTWGEAGLLSAWPSFLSHELMVKVRPAIQWACFFPNLVLSHTGSYPSQKTCSRARPQAACQAPALTHDSLGGAGAGGWPVPKSCPTPRGSLASPNLQRKGLRAAALEVAGRPSKILSRREMPLNHVVAEEGETSESL